MGRKKPQKNKDASGQQQTSEQGPSKQGQEPQQQEQSKQGKQPQQQEQLKQGKQPQQQEPERSQQPQRSQQTQRGQQEHIQRPQSSQQAQHRQQEHSQRPQSSQSQHELQDRSQQPKRSQQSQRGPQERLQQALHGPPERSQQSQRGPQERSQQPQRSGQPQISQQPKSPWGQPQQAQHPQQQQQQPPQRSGQPQISQQPKSPWGQPQQAQPPQQQQQQPPQRQQQQPLQPQQTQPPQQQQPPQRQQQQPPQRQQQQPVQRQQQQQPPQHQQPPQPQQSLSRQSPQQQPQQLRETSPQVSEPKESAKGQTKKGKQSEPKPKRAQGGGGDSKAQEPALMSGPLDLIMPKRASSNSKGTLGRPITVETNHLLLNIAKLNPTVHYDVAIDPDKPRKLLRPAMEAFRLKYYKSRYQAFDGSKNLYAASLLPFGDEIRGEVEIVDEERKKKFNITVKFAAMIDMSVLSKYFMSRDINPQTALQCLDVVLRSAPSLNCISVGRSFFTKPKQLIDLGEGMEMYYGFYQSAILGWKPFLNVDVVHKAFPKSLQIIDLIAELCPRVDLRSKLPPFESTKVDKFLRMLKVSYQIPNNPSTKRVMRINQLDQTAAEAKFTDDSGVTMTVAAYFTKVKKYQLKYPNLPCAWVGNKQRPQRILFPLELCTLLDGQVTNRTMTPNQTSSMIRYAATSSDVRKSKIMHSINDAQYNQDPCAREFGLTVNTEFSRVPARILDSPSLKYGGNRTVKPSKGVWRATTFQNGKVLSEWGMCSFDGRTRSPALEEFSRAMIQQGGIVGMNIGRPQFLDCVSLSFRGAKQEIEQQFKKYAGKQLIVVVIPDDLKDIYNYVKQVSELILGTLTQCVKGRNVFRPKDATVANILLKVNAKLNGTNHILGVKPPCLMSPCMIMGADVTHPSPESRGTTPSVAAVTASHDQFAFQYNICWRLQPPTNEIIADLENITREQLMFFYRQNKGLKPERIIFFRDGVSEGQFPIVLNAEVQAIRNACLKLQKDGMFKPKITFLVVQKRHHTRFFPLRKEDSDDAHRNFNVPAGTIVDTDITHPTDFDFYLVSHASIQGVARPTRYRKLWDDSNMGEDELEQLTYHLCHMFTRCTRSVSYPAPTYYAHLAAARAKVYCENRQLNMNRLQDEQNSMVIKKEIVTDLPMFFV